MTAPMVVGGMGQRVARARRPAQYDDGTQPMQQQAAQQANYPTMQQPGQPAPQQPQRRAQQPYGGGGAPQGQRQAAQQGVSAAYAPQPVYRARSVVTGQPIAPQGQQATTQPQWMIDRNAAETAMSQNANPTTVTQDLPTNTVNSQGAPAATASATRTRNPALEARYIGRSDGAQRYLGSDGRQYTNADRAQAATAENAAQEWDLAGQWEREAQGDQTRQQQSQAGFDDAAGGLRTVRGRLQAYRPTNTEAFDPSRLENLQPTETENTRANWQEGWSPDSLDSFRSAETEGVDTGAVDNYRPEALSRVNSGRVANYDGGARMQSYLQQTGGNAPIGVQAGSSSFDPTEAINTYARGAAGQAKFALQDALEQATNSAAAGGRVDSGLFDKDKGTVISRVGEDLNNQIAQQAVQGAQIKASIENANSGNVTQANIAQGNLAGDAAALRSGEARTAGQLGLDALTNALGVDADVATSSDDLRLRGATASTDARLRRASTIDNNALTATEASSRLGLTRAQGVDDANARRAEFRDTYRQTNTRDTIDSQQRRGEFLDSSTLDALVASGQMTQGEAELYAQMNENNVNRTGDRIASERDRITARQNYASESTARDRQSRRDMWGNIIGGVTSVAGAYAGGR